MAPDDGGWDTGFLRNGATSAARRSSDQTPDAPRYIDCSPNQFTQAYLV
jgi:hypothetical protein